MVTSTLGLMQTVRIIVCKILLYAYSPKDGVSRAIACAMLLYYAFSEISRASGKNFAEKTLFYGKYLRGSYMEIICSVSYSS